ncbi:DUF6414 family protein [Priestia flexa]|uniref:DUF6414 family protein n=1 Tax=Priestia flexa TaxID=86664 RepID=UPI003F867510
MKEIIYLDTDLMNSMLAQLDEGLITSFSAEESMQEQDTEGVQDTKAVNGRLGYLGFGVGAERRKVNLESKAFLEGQKDVLNKIFDDYALDILANKLSENELLNTGPNFKEGDITLNESTYSFFDFELIKNVADNNSVQKFMLSSVYDIDLDYKQASKLVKKTSHNTQEKGKLNDAQKVVEAHEIAQPLLNIFNQIGAFSSYTSQILGDIVVLKSDNQVALIKKKFLRVSSEALSFRTDSSRKAKLLVRVIGKKSIVYGENNMPEFKPTDIAKIPNVMLDILLGAFEIIKKDDYLVTPIAVYYE